MSLEWPDLVFPPINLWSLWRMKEPMIYFKKLNDKAKLPARGSKEAAGLDLSCVEGFVLHANERLMVGTGLAVELPWGSVGYIKPRSKLANKFGIDILAGVVDSDYRGEVKVILYNTGKEDVMFSCGDAVAQFVVQPVDMSSACEATDLDSSERGASGINCEDLRL